MTAVPTTIATAVVASCSTDSGATVLSSNSEVFELRAKFGILLDFLQLLDIGISAPELVIDLIIVKVENKLFVSFLL